MSTTAYRNSSKKSTSIAVHDGEPIEIGAEPPQIMAGLRGRRRRITSSQFMGAPLVHSPSILKPVTLTDDEEAAIAQLVTCRRCAGTGIEEYYASRDKCSRCGGLGMADWSGSKRLAYCGLVRATAAHPARKWFAHDAVRAFCDPKGSMFCAGELSYALDQLVVCGLVASDGADPFEGIGVSYRLADADFERIAV